MQCADDSRRDCSFKPERAADRDDGVADDESAGVAERKREQLGHGRIDLQDREICRGIGADHMCGEALAVPELDGKGAGTFDDVRVGHDVAVTVEDEA